MPSSTTIIRSSIVVKEEPQDDSFPSSKHLVKKENSSASSAIYTANSTNDDDHHLYVDIPLSSSTMSKFPPGCSVVHFSKDGDRAEFVTIDQLAIHLINRETAYKFTSRLTPSNYHSETNLSFGPETPVWCFTDGSYRKAVIVSSSSPQYYSVICLETNQLFPSIPDECVRYRNDGDAIPPPLNREEERAGTKRTSMTSPQRLTLQKSTHNRNEIVTPSPPAVKRKRVGDDMNEFAVPGNTFHRRVSDVMTSSNDNDEESQQEGEAIRNNISRRVSNVMTSSNANGVEESQEEGEEERNAISRRISNIVTSLNNDKKESQEEIRHVPETREETEKENNTNNSDESSDPDLSAYQRVEDRQQKQSAPTNSTPRTQKHSGDPKEYDYPQEAEEYTLKDCQKQMLHSSTSIIPRKRSNSCIEVDQQRSSTAAYSRGNDERPYEKMGDPAAQVRPQQPYDCKATHAHNNAPSQHRHVGCVMVPEWANLLPVKELVLNERSQFRKRHGCSVNVNLSHRLMHPTLSDGPLKIEVTTKHVDAIRAIVPRLQRIVAESVSPVDQSLMMYDLAFLNQGSCRDYHEVVVERDFAYNYVPPRFTEKKWIGVVPISPPLRTKQVSSLFLDNDGRLVRSISKTFGTVVLLFLESKVQPHILLCSRQLDKAVEVKARILKELDRLLY